MAEETLKSVEPEAPVNPDLSRLAADLVGEARSTSNISADRRVGFALELAAFAAEHGFKSGREALTLGRQLRSVADACTEATILAHGLVGRAPPSGA